MNPLAGLYQRRETCLPVDLAPGRELRLLVAPALPQ